MFLLLQLATFILATANVCSGLPQIDEIVNGVDASQGEFPFLVELDTRFGRKWYQICGGSLLTPTTVLTAAHCVDDDIEAPYRIVAGQHILSVNEGTEQIIRVASVLVHPNYNRETFNNDIALLYLVSAVDLSLPNVAVIPKLSTASLDREAVKSDTAVTCGWGYINDKQLISAHILQKLDTRVLTNGQCNRKLRNFGLSVEPEMICSFNKKAGICNGDSGGILGFYKNGVFIQLGVTSWGPNLLCKNGRQVFARVSSAKLWIENNM